uniref:Uncharacterized protein n=1 Tax=Tetranychus urticae TaxID=32264 RepID=T1KUY9_TETUR
MAVKRLLSFITSNCMMVRQFILFAWLVNG